MLWGLLLAVLPIALHLLLRRRARVVSWGAMQFLNRVLKRQHRQLQIQSWVHLLVRVMILVALALALADPRREEDVLAVRDPRSVHRILVLDASMSMQTRQPGGSRFERARAIADAVLMRHRVGDSWQLLVHAGEEEHAVISRPAYDADAVKRELDGLSPTFLPGDVQATFASVASALEQVPQETPVEILFLTDLQAADWRGTSGLRVPAPAEGEDAGTAASQESPPRTTAGDAGSERQRRLNRLFQHLSRSARLILIDVGTGEPGNLAVTDMAVPGQFVRPGEPVPVPVTVENFGPDAAEVTVELLVDSVPTLSRTVDVAGRGSVQIPFELTIPSPGTAVLEARIPDDPLRADNQRWAALPVRNVLEILVVEGRRERDGERSAADYLKLALDPPRPSDANGPALKRRFQLTRIGESRLQESDLSRFDVLVLADVALINRDEAERIAEFVSRGGGLLVTLGEQTRGESYRVSLGEEGAGLLPATWGSLVGGIEEDRKPLFFVPAEKPHPIIDAFADHPEAGLRTSRIYRYFQLDLPAEESEEDVRTILKLSNGDPLLVERPAGLGTVLLLGTKIDRAWGSWVVWPSFVPLMHESVQHAAGGRSRTVNSLVTEPVPLPSLSSSPLPLFPSAPLQSDPTLSAPGAYTVELERETQPWTVVRNVETRESNLTRISAEQLRAGALRGVRFEVVADAIIGLSDPRDRFASESSPLARWLILLVIGLVLTDLLLARHFPSGLLLLAALAAGSVTAWWTL
jgi:hypothetical protein